MVIRVCPKRLGDDCPHGIDCIYSRGMWDCASDPLEEKPELRDDPCEFWYTNEELEERRNVN